MHTDDLSERLIAHGVARDTAERVPQIIADAQSRHAPHEAWQYISRELLQPARDFALHADLYERCYATAATSAALRPAWLPTPDVVARANVTTMAASLGLADYAALHRWSVEHREDYWRHVVERLGIVFRRPFSKLGDYTEPTRPRWFVGGTLNIVENCFGASPDAPAVIEGTAEGALHMASYRELRALTARVANGLRASGLSPGDAVGVILPLSLQSVAVYLGIIAAGGVAVSIADSFSGDEIMLRLRLTGARRVFTQDIVPWCAKRLELYRKLVEAGAPPAVVLRGDLAQTPALRPGDFTLGDFLSDDTRLQTTEQQPHDPINILFSSGTTGEPKAIPLDHTMPLKAASDAHFHQDVHAGDIACWPTSLGWVMGPWLIFSSLLNRATMALYRQAPTEGGFGRFVQNAGVTMLGSVPSLVRTWRQNGCMESVDWTNIRAFSTTGECSNPTDILYLMHLAGYRPVIEYCGGTELGGGYVAGTVVQPSIPSTFTTKALGIDFVLLDDEQKPTNRGEVYLDGPAIGFSARLLNRDHDAIYFRDVPIGPNGFPLRRHGDELETLPGGYYRVAGRCDDTMNLGGIKVGCAEIERVLNPLPGIQETAAIAVPPPGGGPSRLVIFIVRTPGTTATATSLQHLCQGSISTQLNPLFHIDQIRLVEALPRTASNKIMRRELRAQVQS